LGVALSSENNDVLEKINASADQLDFHVSKKKDQEPFAVHPLFHEFNTIK
jgi:hypothetical protein